MEHAFIHIYFNKTEATITFHYKPFKKVIFHFRSIHKPNVRIQKRETYKKLPLKPVHPTRCKYFI